MASEKRAIIACYNCRKRKVRCDRKIPNCSPCRNLQRSCNYPEEIKKPGPRLGSVHRKRQIREAAQHMKNAPVYAESNLCEDTYGAHDRDDDESVLSFAEAAYGPTRQQQNKDIQSISYIIHPSHEYCEVPNSKSDNSSRTDVTNTDDRAMLYACRALGVTRESMQVMLDAFFRTYTAFHLFRESTAISKFLEIAADSQITALLAAIAIFTHRYVVNESDSNDGTEHTSRFFSEMAEQHINQAIAQCGDDSPPLCVLQALILLTHWQLVQGVRGRAWRSLGLCIRIAYELGLHAIDTNPDWHLRQRDPEQWCQDEERRRAWWAIWEMDVFASTLYRVPSTIKWEDAQVWLPAEDERWFHGKPQKSCCLQTRLLDRCKDLQKSGNESPKAWFIILNSLMAEAYESSFRRKKLVKKDCNNGRSTDSETNHDTVFIETLLNAIQACALSVPAQWRYRGQFLSFEGLPNERETTGSTIHRDSSIYDIALMQEVAKLMTLKNYVFEGGAKQLLKTVEDSSHDGAIPTSRPATYQKNQLVHTYFHASDAIMGILANCSESHIRYTNPFIAHAAWMAAAVQLLRLELVKAGPQQDLIRSRFEVLQATHRQFVQYWSMSSVPLQNLKTLAVQLKHWMQVSSTPGIRNSQLGSVAKDAMSRHNPFNPTRGNRLNGNNSTSIEKEFESEAQGMAPSRDVPARISARSSASLHKGRIDLVSSSSPVWPSPGHRSASVNSQLEGGMYDDLATEANYANLGLTSSIDPTTSLSLHPTLMGDTLSTFVGADMSMLPNFNPDPFDWFGVPTDKAMMTPDISNYLDAPFSGVRRE